VEHSLVQLFLIDTHIACTHTPPPPSPPPPTHTYAHTFTQVLQERLCGLTAALENASVEKSEQQTLVNSMSRELQETQEFIAVSHSSTWRLYCW